MSLRMLPIILASTSRHRRNLLEQLRLPFVVAAPICDETPAVGESAIATATRLAQAKAHSIASRFPAALIIGSDQVALLDGQQIGKPRSIEHGVEMLTWMSSRTVVFYSALALLNTMTGRLQHRVATTRVTLRSISATLAQRYLSYEPEALHCTGSTKSEGIGSALIKSIDTTDPHALIGIPLFELVTMLINEGVEIL